MCRFRHVDRAVFTTSMSGCHLIHLEFIVAQRDLNGVMAYSVRRTVREDGARTNFDHHHRRP